MSRALVTGGSGFLGSHLCEYLLEKGHQVICMDSLITGAHSNVAQIKHPDFSFIRYDVTNYVNIDGPLDFIFHFASPASPIDYQKFPIQTLKVGSLGTHNTLGLAKDKNARYLLASTSEVYGDPLVHPQTEDYWGNVNPIGLRGVYDEAKRFAEAMVMAYHRYHNLGTRIVRIFNTFGPRMRIFDGRAVPTLMRQAILGEDLTIHGDGSQTRSFCYVSDMIEGFYKMMMSDYSEPINMGNPQEMTILEMARLIIKLTSSKSKLVFEPRPPDDPQVRKPEISKAKKILDWKPKVGLEEGLQKTMEWMKKAVG